MIHIVNYYRILGVSYDATFDDIRKAFRNTVKEVHPDKEKGDAKQFNRVKRAYEVIKNNEKRKRYDDLLFKNQTQPLKKKVPPGQNPTATVIHLRKSNRKRYTLTTATLHAAIMMIEIFGNRYFKK